MSAHSKVLAPIVRRHPGDILTPAQHAERSSVLAEIAREFGIAITIHPQGSVIIHDQKMNMSTRRGFLALVGGYNEPEDHAADGAAHAVGQAGHAASPIGATRGADVTIAVSMGRDGAKWRMAGPERI